MSDSVPWGEVCRWCVDSEELEIDDAVPDENRAFVIIEDDGWECMLALSQLLDQFGLMVEDTVDDDFAGVRASIVPA